MFDTDRYAWVRPKSPPPQVQSPTLKKIQNPENVFRSEPPKIDNPQILPEASKHIRFIRRFRYGSILVHSDAYGSQIEPIRHILNFRDFPIFVGGFPDFLRSNPQLPSPPRRLQTHPYHQTLPIRIHPGPFGCIRIPNRAHQAHSNFRGFLQDFPDFVRSSPRWSPSQKFPWWAGYSYFN